MSATGTSISSPRPPATWPPDGRNLTAGTFTAPARCDPVIHRENRHVDQREQRLEQELGQTEEAGWRARQQERRPYAGRAAEPDRRRRAPKRPGPAGCRHGRFEERRSGEGRQDVTPTDRG